MYLSSTPYASEMSILRSTLCAKNRLLGKVLQDERPMPFFRSSIGWGWESTMRTDATSKASGADDGLCDVVWAEAAVKVTQRSAVAQNARTLVSSSGYRSLA